MRGILVARIRATKKGQTLTINGKEVGGKGRDGRKFYEIRKLGKGKWTCSCPAYIFSRGELGKKKPCKHLLKLWNEWKKGAEAGIEVLAPEAL